MLMIPFSVVSKPLLTLGDAVAYFLDEPDPTTSPINGAFPKSSQASVTTPHNRFRRPNAWQPKRHSWFSAVTSVQCLGCILLLVNKHPLVPTS